MGRLCDGVQKIGHFANFALVSGHYGWSFYFNHISETRNDVDKETM